MKILNLLFILTITFITVHQSYAQSRDSEQHPTRLPVNIIVDKTSADGNWMKVYEIGGGMHDDLITEMFISDESDINTDELDRLDLVKQYQLLFGLSEMVPHGLITVVAEQQAKELEMANWELVSTLQIQGEDCLMPGENTPPVWPKDIELPPCPEPEPEPIGKEPLPPQPEPTPPGNGKPLAPHCWSENKFYWNIFYWIVYGRYDCKNYQGSFELKDWAKKLNFKTTVNNGTLAVTFGYWKASGWVFPYKDTPFPAKEGQYTIYKEFGNGNTMRTIEIAGNPDPESYYHWELEVNKDSVFTILNSIGFLYPEWPCVVDDSIIKPDDDLLIGCDP